MKKKKENIKIKKWLVEILKHPEYAKESHLHIDEIDKKLKTHKKQWLEAGLKFLIHANEINATLQASLPIMLIVNLQDSRTNSKPKFDNLDQMLLELDNYTPPSLHICTGEQDFEEKATKIPLTETSFSFIPQNIRCYFVEFSYGNELVRTLCFLYNGPEI